MATRTVTARLHLETPDRGAQGTASQRVFRRRAVRYGLLGFNILLLTAVGYFVLQSAGSTTDGRSPTVAAGILGGKDPAVVDPMDRLSSADIAVNIARVTNLPQTNGIVNQADSENVQLAVVQASDSLVTKPQVVTTAYKSNKDIQVYTAKSGDTAASIAAQFHVTTDSILWSNDLVNSTVANGQKLFVPPMNGIVYVVKDGDTPEKLAEKYRSNKEKIIAANDAEITGLIVGSRILIPDGQVVPVVQATSSSGGYSSGFPWGGGPLYGGNGYVRGYCTWYVANRIAVPSNWGNANTWDNLAPRSGWTVSTVPRPGAIAQTDRGAEGHVAVVEDVMETPEGVKIKYSDMNGLAGWNRPGTSDWVAASRFEHYIYR